MDTQYTEQALMNLGFLPVTRNNGITYGGFEVTREDNGDSRIVYVLATGADRFSTEVRRATVGSYISRMERELSRKGWKVTMFEPDTGTDFWLRVQAEDTAYQLPGETEEAYTERMDTASDRAAWAAQDR
jgi:hypothetical protein